MSRAYPWPLPALVWKYRRLASELGPHHVASQAARGRMNARMGRVPPLTGPDAENPAAIAAHRALGKEGYRNRGWRRAHNVYLQATAAVLQSDPSLGTLYPNIST